MSELPDAGVNDKRIAVIAIHGVGDHEQFTTAREIGDLLCNLEYKPSRTPRYAPFTEIIKRIHVRPVHVQGDSPCFKWTDQTLQKNTWGPMHALARAVFRGCSETIPETQGTGNSVNTLDHLFMKGQLIDYKGERPEDSYQCLRLEGKRVSPVSAPEVVPSTPAPDTAGEIGAGLRQSGVDLPKATAAPGTQERLVHVYEMHWADLSRLSNAFTQIFGELYQLLFHLGTVSVNNILAAAIHFHDTKGGKAWQFFSWAQGLSNAILAWPIPIFTLFMAAFAPAVFLLGMARLSLSPQAEFFALDGLLALLLVAGTGYVLSRISRIPAFLYPLPIPLIGGLALLFGWLWRNGIDQDVVETVFAAVITALSFGGVWLIIRAYDSRRPGSKVAAAIAGGVLLVTLLLLHAADCFPARPLLPCFAIAICLNALEAAFGLLTLSWGVFYASYGLAHFAGAWAIHKIRGKTRDQAEYVKAKRARWTAQLVLTLSSMLFLVMTLSVWTGIVKAGKRLLPDKGQSEVQYVPSGAVLYNFLWRHSDPTLQRQIDGLTRGAAGTLEQMSERYLAKPPAITDWADQMLSIAGIGFLPILLVAMCIAGLCAAWAMFPSILDEISPPEYGFSKEHAGGSHRAAEKLQAQSSALGAWLNRGFTFMRLGGKLLYWITWLLPFLFLAVNFAFVFWAPGNEKFIVPFTNIMGTLVAGAAIGIFGLAGRFERLSRSFRPLVRVLLDVDNWLREHPRSSNPTARICGRYVSLLRYVSSWRDPASNKPYDALVIVAHSQGTVITADFLRFLKAQSRETGSMSSYDPELELFDRLPIYFFTMGCPLYQLYGLRFPFLYGWARDEAAIREPGKIPDIGPEDAPSPDELGVARWVNAYRSGDYVGRYLWRGGTGSNNWHPTVTSYEGEWDPPAGKPDKVSADQAGKRIEFCIGPGAHTHYWDHTAALIAEVLDRLINNA